jgi:dihydrofolate synthase/folylpolyglutamate synthase
MALLLFKEYCDISVMEVGLGGRLDATNVITPEICVITQVAYDHEAYLGNTLASIAAEKAGILKAGVTVVMENQEPAAEAVVSARARELHCPIIRTADHSLSKVQVTPFDSRFDLDGESYLCNLAGRHQMENAKAAVLVCKALKIEPDHIRKGLETVRWPGRLELVSRNPDFILDGAHNPAGAAALAAYIREFHANRPVWFVYGAMRDKAVQEVAEQLFPLAERIIATAPDFARALRPQAILELSGEGAGVIANTVPEAIDAARHAPPEAVVFFTGSLFMVGEARAALAHSVS